MNTLEPLTEPEFPIARNLAEIERLNSLVTDATNLVESLFKLEESTGNISMKVALAHASELILDALVCMRNAGTIARHVR